MIDYNLHALPGQVTPEMRRARHGHSGAVIWLTGLSGSGKSSIAIAAEKRLFDSGRQVARLDGDHLRQGLCRDLGFSQPDRAENIRRAGEVARLFSQAGFLVLASFIAPRQSMRDAVRAMLPPGQFAEVYVLALLQTCMQRDPKGFYRRAAAGQIADYTGLTQDYEPPTAPDLTLDTEAHSLDACVTQLVDYIEKTFVNRIDL